ncbi:MAG: SDR family oxidoreductase [Microthrixaceae bacterium]|nr:SDR family oxidoreductase [Microthrixaceae bacterium]
MRSHVLVTGATGFVGAALVLELLEKTDARLTCLVRHRDGVDPLERLRGQLAVAMDHYETEHLGDEVAGRVGVLVGDVTDPGLAAAAGDLGRVDAVWHSAASLKYRDADAEEIRAHNVEGALNVVALAAAVGASEFNHISTAYVAGRRSGLVAEEAVPAGTETNNQYERSKVDAEEIVAASHMHSRVFRPSIVIGHSRTMAADSSMGVYGFLREMHRFVRRVDDPSLLPELTINADTSTGINLIPVDLVVSSAVEIAASDSRAHYFHLTNSHSALVRDAIPIVCEQLGLPQPRFTTERGELGRLDRILARYLDFYLPYLGGERVFDRTNTDAVVGDRCDHPSGPALAEALVSTWIDQQSSLAG